MKKVYLIIIPVLIIAIAGTVIALSSGTSPKEAAEEKLYHDLHVCSMHPWEASEGPGECEICGMALSPVQGHKHGEPLPDEDNLYVSPSNAMYLHEGPGKDPEDGSILIPIVESPFYSPEDKPESAHSADDHQHVESETTSLWTCGMHPEVISEEPGICPICQMDLVPLKKGSTSGGSLIEIDPVTVQNIGVKLEHAQTRDLSRTITSNGTVVTAEDTEYKVNSRVSGWVEKLYVKKTGEWVKKGRPLLEIYSPELVAAQQEFLIALESAETLKKSGLQKSVESADELLMAAANRLFLWEISEEQVEALKREKTVKRAMTIESPAEGYILAKNVFEGSAVKAGTDLFYLADLRKIWIKAQVFEYELPWVNVKDEVIVRSPYDPESTAKGTIDYIYPVLDAKTRAAEVRVALDNHRIKFKPEMYVDVDIISQPKKNVVTISKQAVVRSGKRDLVFVSLGEGRFEPREVHLGLETDDYYEILHNLSDGEVVAASAQFLLDSEAKLQENLQKRLNLKKKIAGGGMNHHSMDSLREPSHHQE